jgi:hypothetical protein
MVFMNWKRIRFERGKVIAIELHALIKQIFTDKLRSDGKLKPLVWIDPNET